MRTDVYSVLKSKKTYFSQCGEDGLLEYILSKIPNRNYWCVEFGAWDGKYLSNTFHFIKNKNYNAVLIEADAEKFKQLSTNMKQYPKCVCVNAFVESEGKNKLDNILKDIKVPLSFDLLSIDIDGDDYYVWDSVKTYTPSVVIIELNQCFKPDVKKINVKGSPTVFGKSGTSISSMNELAKSKGYCLITQIGCNAIFVKKEYIGLFYEKEATPEDVFTYNAFSINELSWNEINSLKGEYFLRCIARTFLKVFAKPRCST